MYSQIETAGGEGAVNTKFFGVPDNFLDITMAEFYIPNDM